MSEREEDSGIRRFAASRKVQIRGNEEARLALENNFFNSVAIPLQHAHRMCVEGCPLRQAPQVFEHLFTNISLPLAKVFERGNRRHSMASLLELSGCNSLQIFRKHVLNSREVGKAGEEVQFLRALGSKHARGQKEAEKNS